MHELGFKGSVHDYFKDQSGGQFLIDFDVVGPVPLSMGYAYYGENDADGHDLRAGEMVAEACKMVSGMVDFSDYDWDGDGEVEQVVVLFAGQGEHCCDDDKTIWPHEFQLEYSDYGHVLKLDEMVISTYACCSELSLNGIIDGIGTLCHEFSHCLGLPDMYDTEGNGCFGMSQWDLMDYGCYNGNGFTPCGYTSYERMVCGWLEPEVLTFSRDVADMKPLADGGPAYIIYNQCHPQEYYLIENRQLTGWDSALPGRGLFVLHVDEDEEAWYFNEVNVDPTHQRCTIFHADDEDGTSSTSLEGDPYPWHGNDCLTSTTNPAANLFHQGEDGTAYMPVELTGIRLLSNGMMSFCYTYTGNSVFPDNPSPDVVFYESFNGNTGKGGNDGKWSGNIALAQFHSDHEGWESAKCYGAKECAKFGTSSAHGIVITPPILLNGEYELSFLAAPWGNDANFMWLDVDSGHATLGNYMFQTMKNQQWNEHRTTVVGRGWVQLLFYSNQRRFFLDEVTIRRKDNGIATSFPSSTLYPDNVHSPVFTIDGRRAVTPLPKGCYIQDGKKIIR